MATVDGFGGRCYVSKDDGTALQVESSDVKLLGTGDTWDGTNTSLKDALSSILARLSALES